MATCRRGCTRTREGTGNDRLVNNHAEFMKAMANLANTMEANTAATLQAVQRLGQPAGNRNGNGDGNGNGDENGNDTGAALMTLASFLKVHPLTFSGLTNSTEVKNWFRAMECAVQARHVPANQYVNERGKGVRAYAAEARLNGGLKDNIMTVVAPLEIRMFSELVNKARVVEDCAKKVAEARGNYGYTNN
ncbi:hypothetical protein AHAS_Ahas16G0175300 [Arachis hypogaea]